MRRRLDLWLALVALSALVSACGTREAPTSDLAYDRGRNAMLDGRHDLARTYFAAALAHDPSHAEAALSLAAAWTSGAAQSAVPALEAYTRAVALAQDPTEPLLGIVRLHLSLGDSAAALAALDQLSDESSERPDALTLRARAVLEGDPEQALALAERLLEEEPESAELARIAFEAAVAASLPEAVQRGESALAVDPLSPRLAYVLARAYSRAGETEQAAALAERSQLIRRLVAPDRQDILSGFERLALLEQLEERVSGLRARPLALRARLSLETGDLERAGREIDALGGEDLGLQVELARSLARSGQPQRALEMLAVLAPEAPEHLPLQEAYVRLLIRQDRLDRAKAAVEEALERAEYVARWWVLRSELERRDGAADAAVDSRRRACELAPWRDDWRAELVEDLLERGLRDDAMAALAGAPEPTDRLRELAERRGLTIASWSP